LSNCVLRSESGVLCQIVMSAVNQVFVLSAINKVFMLSATNQVFVLSATNKVFMLSAMNQVFAVELCWPQRIRCSLSNCVLRNE